MLCTCACARSAQPSPQPPSPPTPKLLSLLTEPLTPFPTSQAKIGECIGTSNASAVHPHLYPHMCLTCAAAPPSTQTHTRPRSASASACAIHVVYVHRHVCLTCAAALFLQHSPAPQAKIGECEAGAAKMRAQSKAAAKQLEKLRKDSVKQGGRLSRAYLVGVAALKIRDPTAVAQTSSLLTHLRRRRGRRRRFRG